MIPRVCTRVSTGYPMPLLAGRKYWRTRMLMQRCMKKGVQQNTNKPVEVDFQTEEGRGGIDVDEDG